jgi:hypothetical protein
VTGVAVRQRATSLRTDAPAPLVHCSQPKTHYSLARDGASTWTCAQTRPRFPYSLPDDSLTTTSTHAKHRSSYVCIQVVAVWPFSFYPTEAPPCQDKPTPSTAKQSQREVSVTRKSTRDRYVILVFFLYLFQTTSIA